MTLQPLPITGSSLGLVNNVKPYLLHNQAFQYLINAYVFRERVKKREGIQLLGRLSRVFLNSALGVSGASPWTFNVFTILGITEVNREIKAGSVTIVNGAITFTDFNKSGTISGVTNAVIAVVDTGTPHLLTTGDNVTIAGVGGMTEINGLTFTITVVDATHFSLDNTDSTNFGVYTAGGTWTSNPAQGNGNLVSATAGNSGTINYRTGDVTLTYTGPAAATTISFIYFPGLPVMGIFQRELGNINNEETVFFDTRYAYIFSGSDFQEFVTGVTWQGNDSNFFWSANYRGIVEYERYFFVTNFYVDTGLVLYDPIRYYNGTTWVDFAPLVTAANTLYQCKLIIPYYGRLLALNTWEGTTAGGIATAQNYFNRCRFSQVGTPIVTGAGSDATAWRQDIFGKGGFIDAPTNEAITSAAFIKNTLIVFFEKTTWQLRYVGEYGLPFLWERVSSDFGSESKSSTVLFNDGVLTFGDKGIISANAVGVTEIDHQIPDFIFDIRNAQNGIDRVVGIREYQRELVYWTCTNSNTPSKFPNQVLVYNYQNNTYAIFRDNVTFFGTYQPPLGVTWGDFGVFWGDYNVFWNDPDTQSEYPWVVSGNQQGFVHYYAAVTMDQPSLAITAINVGVSPVQITVPDHNLESGETIYITGVLYTTSTNINNRIYNVSRFDGNKLELFEWNFTTEQYDIASVTATGTYIGGGRVTLLPFIDMRTKDFNPYAEIGRQMRMSYIDFMLDVTDTASMSVNLWLNSSPATVKGNMLIGNRNVPTSTPQPYYTPTSQYAWHRFYAQVVGQFVGVQLTYDDNLRNKLLTYQQDWELNSFTLWSIPGGRQVN